MRVDFYALLRMLSGSGSIQINLPASANLRLLLSAILKQYPAMRPHLLDEEGNLRSEVPVFVNGRNPRLSPNGLDQALPADSVVSIFSPISSGRLNVEVLAASRRKGSRGVQEKGS